MNMYTILLMLEITCIGLFSGLMWTVISVMQPLFKSLSEEESLQYTQRFLSFAYKNPFFTSISVIATFLPLFFIWQTRIGGATFIVLLIGWLGYIVGVNVVTVRLSTPIYRKITNWNREHLAEDWQQLCKRLYMLNFIRGIISTIAFLLFLFSISVLR